MRIFVTGGTGLLGNTILRQLSHAGHELLSLVRGRPDPAVFDGIETEFTVGDLLDRDLICKAVSRCDAVIHSAALIHIGWQRLDESIRVNRDGTRVVVDACLKHGRKLVHVGTVNTLAIGTRHAPADETTPLNNGGGQVPCSYMVSKLAATAQVQWGVEQGLKAVIVNPGFMLGPWDWKPSSGRMILELGRGWKPIAPSGGCCVCDSRDVAAATIAAMLLDIEDGRQYILGGENWRYVDLWREIANRMGTQSPLLAAGPLQRWIGGIAGDLWSLVSSEPNLNSAAIKIASQFHWYDSSRARRELGYQTRDVKQSLDDAADWIKAHHFPAAVIKPGTDVGGVVSGRS